MTNINTQETDYSVYRQMMAIMFISHSKGKFYI